MVNGKETWLDVLLEAVEAKVAAAGVVTRDRVFSSEAADQDLIEAPPADRFVAVRPTSFPISQGIVGGGGRPGTGFDGRILVTAFARHQFDQEFRSGVALKGADGTLAMVKAILGALQLYLPTDKDGNGLLREPMRLAGFEMNARRMKDGKSAWSVCATGWELKFTADIAATVP